MLFGRDVVPTEIMGIRASNLTYGHRFMAPKALKLANPDELCEGARTQGPRHRRLPASDARLIRQGVAAAAERIGGTAVIEDALLDEVTGLVEWPVPLAGRFDAQFLELPPEVPIATMQDHQRYFPVRNAHRRLLPWFVTVANIESQDPSQVIAGNERVVRPRLSDAAFFYEHRPPVTRSSRIGSVAARDVPDAARFAASTRANASVGSPRAIAAAIGGDQHSPTAQPSWASATC